jgi:DNA-binding MarR family transcriptional regulator
VFHLSRDSDDRRAELLGELARELQQLNGLSASFFRAAAARVGVTVTDMQVIECLVSTGPQTAGQLADLTGLTTGAITGIVDRLEKAGLAQRASDPNDARKVIVRLASDRDRMRELGPVLDLVAKAWEEETAQYDDEQIALIVRFLRRGNALARREILMLREAPAAEGGPHTVPLGELASGRLIVTGSSHLTLRATEGGTELYRARFEGSAPEVKVVDGVVGIRYPRRLWMGGTQREADINLNSAIPWQIEIQGGASTISAELGNLMLAGLEVKGGMSLIHLELPVPSGVVRVRISGGASEIDVRRPAGVAARVHLKGWVSTFAFDGQSFSDVGNNVRLQSVDFTPDAPSYDIEVSSSASSVSITTDR